MKTRRSPVEALLLETSFGDIDATLENQFDQIASLIWQEIEHSNPAPPFSPDETRIPTRFWSQCQRIIQGAETIKNYGQVIQVIGLVIEGIGPASAIGDHLLPQDQKRRKDDPG